MCNFFFVPHAGYEVCCFDVCFDDLRKTVLDGQRKRLNCMVGETVIYNRIEVAGGFVLKNYYVKLFYKYATNHRCYLEKIVKRFEVFWVQNEYWIIVWYQ